MLLALYLQVFPVFTIFGQESNLFRGNIKVAKLRLRTALSPNNRITAYTTSSGSDYHTGNHKTTHHPTLQIPFSPNPKYYSLFTNYLPPQLLLPPREQLAIAYPSSSPILTARGHSYY